MSEVEINQGVYLITNFIQNLQWYKNSILFILLAAFKEKTIHMRDMQYQM